MFELLEWIANWMGDNLGWSVVIYLSGFLVIYFVAVYLEAVANRHQGQSVASAAQTAVNGSSEWAYLLIFWPLGVLLLPFLLPLLVVWGLLSLVRTAVERTIAFLIRNVEPGEW